MNRKFTALAVWTLALSAALGTHPAAAQRTEPLPKELEGVGITEHLGEKIPLDLEFVDEHGDTVRLGDYFDGQRPVIMTLGYYACPMLCDLVLNGMLDALKQIDFNIGEEFDVITVSIDPTENDKLANLKKQNYIKEYGKAGAAGGWHFLTGEQEEIDAISSAIGFGYRWNEGRQEFMHAAAIYVLSPDGTITRYLYGVMFEPRDLKLALLEGSDGKIGTTFDHALLYCYVYDASKGRYGPAAMNIMRAAGYVTVLVLAIFLGGMWIRERRNRFEVGDGQPAK